MNPSEKIKCILDGITQPLYKDDPFEMGGRKAVFDTSTETRSLSFQAFVNRMNTFRSENWGSDPNAALYLARHGFQTVSGYKVCCCSCLVEVDMAIFMGKADALQTIAVKSHKKACRWRSVVTPSVYFKMPSDPLKTVEDFKITLGDLMSVGPVLPIIQRRTYVKIGLQEDIASAVLSSFGSEVTDALASALVLGLCGWVKNTDSSLQCNFCRRVVGTWNFFGVENNSSELSNNTKQHENNSSELSNNTKQHRVVSLLYNEIRRSMIPDDTDNAESNKIDADLQYPTIPESVEQIQNVSCNDGQGDVDETVEFNYPRNRKSNGPTSLVFAQMLKKRSIKFLSIPSQKRRIRCSESLRLNLKMAAPKRSKQEQATAKATDSTPASESVMEEEKPDLCCDSKEHSDTSNGKSDNIVNKQLQVDPGCNGSNVASSTENGFHVIEHENSEESFVPPVQPSLSSHTVSTSSDDKCCSSVTTSEVKSSNNTIDGLDADVHSKSISSKEISCSSCPSEKSHTSISHDDCDTQVESSKCVQFYTAIGLNNICDSPSIQSVLSDQPSCLSTERPGEILRPSEGRRKRKRIPSHERNGTSFDSELLPHLPAQLEPVHFTRSKKKELEMLLNEHIKPKLESKVEKRIHVDVHGLDKDHDVGNVNTVDHDEENMNDVDHDEENVNFVDRDKGNVNTVDYDEKSVYAVDNDKENVNNVDSDVNNVLTRHELNNPVKIQFVDPNSIHVAQPGQIKIIIPNDNVDENEELVYLEFVCPVDDDISVDASEENNGKKQSMQQKNHFEGGPIIVSSKSVSSEKMFQDYVAEEGRNLENVFVRNLENESEEESEFGKVVVSCLEPVYNSDEEQKCEICDNTENNAQEIVSDSSSVIECSISGKDSSVIECSVSGKGSSESGNVSSVSANVSSVIECSVSGKDSSVIECSVSGNDSSVIECSVSGKDSSGSGNVSSVSANVSSFMEGSESESESENDSSVIECSVSGKDSSVIECGVRGKDSSVSGNVSSVSANVSSFMEGSVSGNDSSVIECSVSGKDVDNTHVARCKRKREGTDESNNHISKKPNLEDYKLELCKTYFHPELEHRYWCIWRIKLADFLGVSKDPKKGWQHYLQVLQKGLELINSEKRSLYQAESEVETLSFITAALATSKYKK